MANIWQIGQEVKGLYSGNASRCGVRLGRDGVNGRRDVCDTQLKFREGSFATRHLLARCSRLNNNSKSHIARETWCKYHAHGTFAYAAWGSARQCQQPRRRAYVPLFWLHEGDLRPINTHCSLSLLSRTRSLIIFAQINTCHYHLPFSAAQKKPPTVKNSLCAPSASFHCCWLVCKNCMSATFLIAKLAFWIDGCRHSLAGYYFHSATKEMENWKRSKASLQKWIFQNSFILHWSKKTNQLLNNFLSNLQARKNIRRVLGIYFFPAIIALDDKFRKKYL